MLWKKWRLLENRELYDVEQDPHQDQNVASEHPEVVVKLRAHLESWWDGVKDDVMTPQRVIVGSDEENPMLLTACEWLDVFVDQQIQVRRGDRKNGVWHLEVAESGSYEIELRRWPRESGRKLQDSVTKKKVTDGEFIAGPSMPIHSARLRFGDQNTILKPDLSQQSFTQTIELTKGKLQLQATFLDSDDKELCGAYYLYLNRLTN